MGVELEIVVKQDSTKTTQLAEATVGTNLPTS